MNSGTTRAPALSVVVVPMREENIHDPTYSLAFALEIMYKIKVNSRWNARPDACRSRT